MWARERQHRLCQSRPALEEEVHFAERSGGRHSGAFGCWLQEEHPVQADTFVAEEVRLMCAGHNLPSGPSLHPGKHLREECDDVGMQGQLRFLE